MKTRKKKKTSKGSETKDVKADPKESLLPDDFDYGGLPIRDIKKNLGCG